MNISSIGLRTGRRIIIEDVYPSVDGGRFPIKRIAGEPVGVWADVVRDGHAVVAADLLWRPGGAGKWSRVAMRHHGNDRWTATFTPPKPGRYEYAIETWTDVFGTWRRDILAKRLAGLDVSRDALEGPQILKRLRPRNADDARLIGAACRRSDTSASLDHLLAEEIATAAATDQQTDLTRSATFQLVADRPLARAGAWYEMVPRSQGRIPSRHGTFDDSYRARTRNRIARLRRAVSDPHPSDRPDQSQGPQQRAHAGPGDPGSPYAIGSADGGHDAIHPELGTLDDFRRLVAACAEHGHGDRARFRGAVLARPSVDRRSIRMVQRRPDGSIQYAENPPKKYEDIVNPDFYAPTASRAVAGAARRGAVLGRRRACASSGSTIRTPSRFRSGNG